MEPQELTAVLVEQLQEDGTAWLEVTPDRPVWRCRTALIAAAQQIDVRIRMKRLAERDPPFIRMVATVLTGEEARLAQERDTIFRVVNHLRANIRALDEGTTSTELLEDSIGDLGDIADELEDYARKLVSRG